MYQTDTGPCDIYTKSKEPVGGWTGPTAARINAQVAAANAGWDSVLYPGWQSFVSLGPQAALQAMNPPYTSSAGGGQAIGAPGGSSSPGTIAATGPGSVVEKNGLTRDQNQFLSIFGPYRPFQTFTGPLPAVGTSGSLVYGGSVFNRPAAGPRVVSSPGGGESGRFSNGGGSSSGPGGGDRGGISTRATPGSCDSFVGVNALPVGEPVYSDSSAGSGGAGSPSSGWQLAALAALGLLAAGYLMNEDDKRRGRA